MRHVISSRLLVLGALVALGAACYTDRIDNIRSFGTVVTLVDSQAPLRAARTFAMPDTIVVIRGMDILTHAHDSEILARIRSKFIAAGWIEVDPRRIRPDVVVLTSALAQEHTGTVSTAWWGPWGYWPGWPTAYGSDWIWGVPGTEFEFTYATGTLIITMLDVNDADAGGRRIPALWVAAVNGVLTVAAVDGALIGIDQAFVQSPYLVRP
jgi:hypothetical protein